MKKRTAASIIALGSLALLSVAHIPASAATNARQPSFCSTTTAIVATKSPISVALKNCHIQGRQIVMRLPSGAISVGVHVPRSGFGEGNVALAKTGEYELSTVNVHGMVTIREAVRQADSPGLIRPADAACNENAYNTEGPFWYSNNSTPSDSFNINESTSSRAGLTESATESDIRQAVRNLTQGLNNCGFTENNFPVTAAFQGTTSYYANVDSTGSCTSKFPDGHNVVSFGPFDSSVSSLLALTCYSWNTSNSHMSEADTYIGSNRGMVDTLPSNCSSSYDLQSIMTHEWGHAYGLAHETSGIDEVMYPTKSPCSLRRHLGSGDYSGMSAIYG